LPNPEEGIQRFFKLHLCLGEVGRRFGEIWEACVEI
jgi:hypothetical protein